MCRTRGAGGTTGGFPSPGIPTGAPVQHPGDVQCRARARWTASVPGAGGWGLGAEPRPAEEDGGAGRVWKGTPGHRRVGQGQGAGGTAPFEGGDESGRALEGDGVESWVSREGGLESEGGGYSRRLGRTCRSSLAPTWGHPSRDLRVPHPQYSAPCLQDPPGVYGRRRRGQHSRRTHTRVPSARLRPARSPGWCGRRRWAASNAAHRASPAQPPPPPRRSPRLACRISSWPPTGPALLGIVRTLLAGCSGWPCSRLQRSVLRAQWPCRLPQHKAGVLPTPLPPRPHWSTCNLGVIQDFCSLLTWRLAGLGFPGSARLHILAVAWDPSGARAPAARGVRAPAGLPGGRREDTHCGSLSPRAGSRAPPAGDVILSASAATAGRGAG